MSESTSFRIDWRRIVIESVAVVCSILLAFSVDALWDVRQERQHEQELLDGLLTDFESSRPNLVSRLELAQRMADGTRSFVDLAKEETLPRTLLVPDSLILAVLGGPTYEPATNTMDAALASGEIEVLQSTELRTELANWRRLLSDTGEDELVVRRLTNELVVPLLARSLNVAPYFDALLAWSGGDPFGPGRLLMTRSPGAPEGHAPLRMTTELLGALSMRSFYVGFSAAGLEELLGSLDRSMALARAEIQ
jgi:hypothetical protein